MRLRHSFKNLPEHTRQIIGKLRFRREVFDLEECAIRVLNTLCDLFSYSLLSLPCFPVGGVSFPPHSLWAWPRAFLWPVGCEGRHVCAAALKTLCLSCAPFLCHKKTCVQQLLPLHPGSPNKKMHGAKLTHRIDPKSPSSPLVNVNKKQMFVLEGTEILGLLVTVKLTNTVSKSWRLFCIASWKRWNVNSDWRSFLLG